MTLTALVLGILASLVSIAYGQSLPVLGDFAAPVPESGSLAWMVGSAAAGLFGLRVYLGKKR